MCGIAGVFTIPSRDEVNRGNLERMGNALVHRGPDASGVHVEPGVGLAHRRLSIIDLASGRQPMFNEDGSVALVYNGEIYNFRELAAELSEAGHVFETRCDTEVVVHAWEEWGEECVKKFRGMFAFAIWDRNRDCLFLARDRLGIKPLYYSLLPNGEFIFASELKALQIHPGFDPTISPPAVEEYFAFGYVPDPRTIFASSWKLAPGHCMLVSRRSRACQQRQYWDLTFDQSRATSTEALEAELIHRLREAVGIRLISDVPLGAFLSGGVDSSAIVALMAGLSEDPVKTSSISFEDAAFDEAAYARLVAERYRTDHRVERVQPADFGLIDQLASLYDEPFADSSAMPTYRVCELARKSVTVALSGDGGDETFAGYRRYRLHHNEQRVRSLVPSIVRAPVFGFLGRAYPKADWAPRMLRAKTTLQSLAMDCVDGYFHSVSVVPDGIRSKLFSSDFQDSLQGYRAVEVFRTHARRAGPVDPLSLAQYLDFKTYLPGDILTKVDRASMAHSLEVRVPILDHEFVEWASGLPPNLKLHRGEGKYLLKAALKPHLPQKILSRRKMGFSVPLAKWFRGPLRNRLRRAIGDGSMAQLGVFDDRFLDTAIEDHISGARDHGALLWSVLMFEAFHRKCVERQEVPPASSDANTGLLHALP